MTSALVGSARIEITGDLTQLGDQITSEFESAFEGLSSAIDSNFAQIVEQFNTGGQDAGAAFTDSATTVIGDGTVADAVGQTATDATATATTEWAAVGDAAGAAYGDTATSAIADQSLDSAVTDSASGADSAATDAWGSIGDLAGNSFSTAAADAISASNDDIDAAVQEAADAFDTSPFADAGDEAGNQFGDGMGEAISGPDSSVITAIPDALDEGKPLAIAAATAVGVESGEAGAAEMGAKGKEAGTRFVVGAREVMKTLGGTLFAGLGVFGAAELVKGSLDAAAESEQAAIKTKNVFGDSSEGITKWSEGAVKSLRETSDIAQLTADSYGQYLHGLGMTQAQAAPMAEQLTTLTANVASFNNVSQTAVQSAFQSALKGRTSALRSLGITIDNTTLQHEAMAHADEMGQLTMKKGVPVLTTQQKGLAAYYALLDQTTNQTHAMADTANTARGRQQELSAQFGEMKTQLGNALLPVLASLSGFLLRDVVPALMGTLHWVQANASWLGPLAKGVALAVGAFAAFKLVMGGLHTVMNAGRGIQDAYRGAMILTGKITDYYGFTTGRAAGLQERYGRAAAASASATTREGEAAGAATPEMDALATSTAAAATAQEDLDVAQRGGVGGMTNIGGAARGASGELEGAAGSAARLEGSAAGAAGELEGVGASAGAVAGEAAGAEGAVAGIGAAGAEAGAAAGVGLMGVLGPMALVAGAGALLGNKLNNMFYGKENKRYADFMGALHGTDQTAKSLADAIQQDGDALGQTSEKMIITKAQATGLDSSFAQAGLSLADLTTGVTGSDAAFGKMATQWQNSVHPSQALKQKLVELRAEYLNGKSAADKLTQQQLALNSALNMLKPPEPIHLKVIDDASRTVGVVKSELLGLDGRVFRTTIEVDATGKGADYMTSGGLHGATTFKLAKGGRMPDGWGVVGEEGPEIIHKQGDRVDVMANAGGMRAAAASTSQGTASHGSAVNSSEIAELIPILRDLANRPAVFRVNGRDLAWANQEGQMRLERR